MKKNMLFIAATLFVCCIVPTATTQAMLQRAHGKDSFVSTPPEDALYVLNQKELPDMITELSNQGIKDTLLSYDLQEPRETTIAQSGKSTTTPPSSKKNPYVKRKGHGRSKMGDAVAVEDNNSKNAGNGDKEEDDGDVVEDEEFGDDSAIQYNKGLKNSSGYNEDL